MTEIKLYASPWKAARLFLLTVPFIAGGIWIVRMEESDALDLFMGWFSVCFFGLGVVASLIKLLDRRPQMILNEKGVWDRSTKQGLIQWEVIQEAYPINVRGEKFLSLVLDKKFEGKIKQWIWARRVNKAIGAQKVNLYTGQANVDALKLKNLIMKLVASNTEQRGQIISSASQRNELK